MAYKLTIANIHDSFVMKDLIKNVSAGAPLYAGSTYRSESIETFCKWMGVGAGSMKSISQ
jgi:hypothetical protein